MTYKINSPPYRFTKQQIQDTIMHYYCSHTSLQAIDVRFNNATLVYELCFTGTRLNQPNILLHMDRKINIEDFAHDLSELPITSIHLWERENPAISINRSFVRPMYLAFDVNEDLDERLRLPTEYQLLGNKQYNNYHPTMLNIHFNQKGQRDSTKEERDGVNEHIATSSRPTGLNFFQLLMPSKLSSTKGTEK